MICLCNEGSPTYYSIKIPLIAIQFKRKFFEKKSDKEEIKQQEKIEATLE